MKKISTKDGQKFVKGLCSQIALLGGKSVPGDTDPTRFEIETIVGRLLIHVDKESLSCYTMYTRFDNVDRAKAKFTCNAFSGKYNFHIGINEVSSPDQAIDKCIMEIERTLPN